MHKSPLTGSSGSVPNSVPAREGSTSLHSAKVLIAATVCVCLTALWASPVSLTVEKSESRGVLAEGGFQNDLKGHGFTGCRKTRLCDGFVSGHDLGHAVSAAVSMRALAPVFACDSRNGYFSSLFSRAVPLPYSSHSTGALQAAEKVALGQLLKGRSFSSAVQALYLATQEKPPVTTDSSEQPTLQPVDLSDEVVRDVLTNLQRGIEAHDLDRVLEIFDQQNMKDYAQFHDQMVAFFRRYDSVKLRYQLLQVTSDKEGGFAIADIDMDADPTDILPTPQRRSTQMRFQLKRTPKGWKVVALRPADFFNQ